MQDVQNSLLNLFLSELTSHGAILFATLTASFTFLRIIENHSNRDNNKKSSWFLHLSFYGLWILLSVSIYVLFRLSVYGNLWNIALYQEPSVNATISSYYSEIIESHKKITNYSNPIIYIALSGSTNEKIVNSLFLGLPCTIALLFVFCNNQLTEFKKNFWIVIRRKNTQCPDFRQFMLFFTFIVGPILFSLFFGILKLISSGTS